MRDDRGSSPGTRPGTVSAMTSKPDPSVLPCRRANPGPTAERRADAQDLPRRLLRRLPSWIAIGLVIDVVLVAWMNRARGGFDLPVLPLGHAALALVLVTVPWLLRAVRIRTWSRVLGSPLSLRQTLRVIFGADLVAAATPTAIGGAPAMAGLLVHARVPLSRALSISAIAAFEDGLAAASLLAFVLSGPFQVRAEVASILRTIGDRIGGGRDLLLWIAVVLILAIALGSVRPFRRRFARGIRTLPWRELRRGGGWCLLTFPLAVLQWSCRYSAVAVLAAGLGITVDFGSLFVRQCLAFTAMVFVPLPGATGGAEGAFLWLHRGLIPNALLGDLTACWRFFTFHVLVVGAAAAVFAGVVSPAIRRFLGVGRSTVVRMGPARPGSVPTPEPTTTSRFHPPRCSATIFPATATGTNPVTRISD
ncbi:MAG: lysylphosphatidylglycerol synthase transmembrane domain-containing protein [Candidatus Eisenbacteria bacterium]